MAKKRKPGGDNPKRRRPARPRPAELLHDLPDPRAMEGVMQKFVRSQLGGSEPDTPLAKAQELMYRAFEERNESRRIEMAKEALAISPDCADAFVFLAERAQSRRVALGLYQQAVAAGERALGPDAFQRDAGHFWGIIETRPFMRARLGLAHALWTTSRRDEAVQHLQDMLRLNPGDNQGVRNTLAGFLLFLDRDDDLARLLGQYPDEETAAWAYTTALLTFRQQGDTLEARQALKRAKKTNKHVPEYLLGRKFPPEQPGFYSPGEESEALNYVGSFMAGWMSTPGAVAWVRENDEKTRKRKKEVPHARGPLALVKRWLKEKLPQEDDVWQADCRQMANWIRIAGDNVRPWVVMVTSRSNDLVLTHEMQDSPPAPALIWDTLVKAMQHPAAGDPHRPTEIEVRAHDHWETLKPHLEEIGVQLVVKDEVKHVTEVFKQMCEHVCGKPQPGLLDMPGVKPEQVGSFFEAAAAFFLQAPWKKVGYEAAIKIECDKFKSGPWYAVLMGQSGLTMGLAMYEDLAALKQVFAGVFGDEENARKSVGTSVMFGEETEIPVADLEAAQQYGWKVARPDAYPSIFHKEQGLSVRPPLSWELELMEGCLRGVPDFVNRRRQEDSTPEAVTVTVAAGELRMVLSWVPETE